MGMEAAEGLPGSGQVRRLIDFLSVLLHRVMAAPPHSLADISHLVHPAALVRDGRVDRLQSGRQAGAAVGNDEMELMTLEAALEQILQHSLPGRLALPAGADEGQQALAGGPNAISR